MKMLPAYYNEIDPFCCQWLRNLIAAGLIPDGFVDERDIREVSPRDLDGFGQCHFFAGIGGWPLALALGRWPATRPVWSASLPCQPFSVAGKGFAENDPRHLWPVFSSLVEKCLPASIVGEQVASKLGRAWLAGVRAALEGMGYAVGAADLCAAGVGAPQLRQRLFWVGCSESLGLGQGCPDTGGGSAGSCENEWSGPLHAGPIGCVGDSDGDGYEPREQTRAASRFGGSLDADGGFDPWSRFDVVACLDESRRRVEPGSFPLAPGVSSRVVRQLAGLGLLDHGAGRSAIRNRLGRLKGYGNAIVPQCGAVFVRSFLEVA